MATSKKTLSRILIIVTLLVITWIVFVLYKQYSNLTNSKDAIQTENSIQENNDQSTHKTEQDIVSNNKIAHDKYGGDKPKTIKSESTTPGKNVSGTNSAASTTTNQWVIVDCGRKKIIKCPHKLLEKNNDNYLQGKCRDVSVDSKSFCGF